MSRTVHDLGRLEIATGCMFGGKTLALIRKYKDIQPFRSIVAFKPSKDDRYSKTDIVSHDLERKCPKKCKDFKEKHCDVNEHWVRKSIPATPFKELNEIDAYLNKHEKTKDLIIDELHFLPIDAYKWFEKWTKQGISVYCAGLNWNYFANKPFETTSNCLAIATDVVFCEAECKYRSKGNEDFGDDECNLPAVRTMWRLKELPKEDKDFVGGEEKYISVCLDHYIPIEKPMGEKPKKADCFGCKEVNQSEDNCNECEKDFCYFCLGRIDNHLFCEECYRQKEKLTKDDKIVRTQTACGDFFTYNWEVVKDAERKWKKEHAQKGKIKTNGGIEPFCCKCKQGISSKSNWFFDDEHYFHLACYYCCENKDKSCDECASDGIEWKECLGCYCRLPISANYDFCSCCIDCDNRGCEKGCCSCYNPKSKATQLGKSVNKKKKAEKAEEEISEPKKLTDGMKQQMKLEQAKQNIDDVIEEIKEKEERDYITKFLKERGEARPKINLKEVKDIVNKKEFSRFYRDVNVQLSYDRVDISEDGVRNKLVLEHYKNPNNNVERWMIHKNDYPYNLTEDLEQWILWDTKGTWEQMEKDWKSTSDWIKKQTLGFTEVLVSWINPPQYRSVNVPHVHLVFEKTQKKYGKNK